MVGELDILSEWIPEQMQPGTVFVLENAGEVGEKEDPYWAVLACPSCGMLGLIRAGKSMVLSLSSAARSDVPRSFSFATPRLSCASRSSPCSADLSPSAAQGLPRLTMQKNRSQT